MDESLNMDEETSNDFKVKIYPNSDGDDFGLTIKGKNKQYLQSHLKIKMMIQKLYSSKQELIISGRGISVLESSSTKSVTVVTVEIKSTDSKRGRVEFKIYHPSQNKKKGATLEMRKMPDFEFDSVLDLKDIVVEILDRFISGEDLKNILNNR